MTIIVVEKNANGYIAYFGGGSSNIGHGNSPAEAIGHLVVLAKITLNIKIDNRW